MPDFVGSEKQVSWAKDIAEATFKNIDFMQNYIEKMVSQYGLQDDGSNAKEGYTISQVKEVRKFYQTIFEQPEMKAAKRVIDQRDAFSREKIEKLARQTFRAGVKWDKKSKTWVKK